MQKTTPRSMLLMMQKSAENTANSEKYSECNDKTKFIYFNSIGQLKALANDLEL